jgi:hypothetical protein
MGNTNDEDPNISNDGTLLVIYVCHLNVLANLFMMLVSPFSNFWGITFPFQKRIPVSPYRAT